MKVLVLHTLPPDSTPTERRTSEFELDAAAEGVASVLPGSVVAAVRGEAREILKLLENRGADVVFNLCEAPMGRPDLEAHVAALFEWAGVRFTGSGSETLALCRRKDRANAVLSADNVAIPPSGGFPCIVKPADEDGSAGIHADSICEDGEAVARAIARLRGPAIVQQFLPGREFAVSLWGRSEPEGVSIGETTFAKGLRLITYAAKWDLDSADFANSPMDYRTAIDAPLRESIRRTACGAWRAVGARGYLRVDIRLSSDGKPFVLDVNPNPELGPGVGIRRAIEEAGWTWERFVLKQVEWA